MEQFFYSLSLRQSKKDWRRHHKFLCLGLQSWLYFLPNLCAHHLGHWKQLPRLSALSLLLGKWISDSCLTRWRWQLNDASVDSSWHTVVASLKQYGVMVKRRDSEASLSGFDSWLHYYFSCNLTVLCYSLICKVGVMTILTVRVVVRIKWVIIYTTPKTVPSQVVSSMY